MAVFLFLNLEEILVKTYLIDNDFQIKIFQMLFDSKWHPVLDADEVAWLKKPVWMYSALHN